MITATNKGTRMKELFNNLMDLANDDDTPFYYSLQTLNDEYYLIFSYHFTDKDSWLLKDALESRGIMFEVTKDVEYIRLASRPMHKFFNHSFIENKGEVDFIDYGTPKYVMDKADGSLISTYLDGVGLLHLKSKASLHSDHAVAATEYLNETANLGLKYLLNEMEDEGYTVNMEWVSPDPTFRIVLYYNEPKLIILNARHRYTGEYYDMDKIDSLDKVDIHPVSVLNDLETAIGIEGYVVVTDTGEWAKMKSVWYLERHRAKDFINQPMAFVELCLKDEADDIFSLVEDQPEIHKEMLELQHKVVTKANHYIANVTNYYNENKDLSRKDYAIKAKAEMEGYEFALAMQYFVKQVEPDWEGFLLQVHKKVNWDL